MDPSTLHLELGAHASLSTTKNIDMFIKPRKSRKRFTEMDICGLDRYFDGRADTVQAPTALQIIPTGKDHHEDSRMLQRLHPQMQASFTG